MNDTDWKKTHVSCRFLFVVDFSTEDLRQYLSLTLKNFTFPQCFYHRSLEHTARPQVHIQEIFCVLFTALTGFVS